MITHTQVGIYYFLEGEQTFEKVLKDLITFFLGRNNFPNASRTLYKKHISTIFFALYKFIKQSKNAVFVNFLESFDQNISFFGRRSPSKLVYIAYTPYV